MTKTIKVIIRHIVAVQKPGKGINDFILNAKGVYKSMNGNAVYPAAALSITLLQFNTDINVLDSMESDLHSVPPKCTTAQRDSAKKVLDKDLRFLLSDVQKLADNSPANAETIITSAGFAVKNSSIGQKFVGAKNTDVSGTIIIKSGEPGPHEWEQSTDEKSWLGLRPTTGGKKTVSGLDAGSVYYFRNRPILTKGEEGAWCDPMLIRVL